MSEKIRKECDLKTDEKMEKIMDKKNRFNVYQKNNRNNKWKNGSQYVPKTG